MLIEEFLFILLPIVGIYAWYMGYRNAIKKHETSYNKLTQQYTESLSFLLDNKQEQAVDLFLQILQKPPENTNDNEQFNAKLTLGNLFRSRGDVQQALTIHQHLKEEEYYSYEQKLLVDSQIANDFMQIGIYDRAENIFLQLIEEPLFEKEALKKLSIIYQRIHDWPKAILVAEKLHKLQPTPNNINLANFYCELLEDPQASTGLANNTVKTLQQALSIAPSSVRVSIMLGQELLKIQKYDKALAIFTNILYKKPQFVGEIIEYIAECYQGKGIVDELENYFIFLCSKYKSKKLELYFIKWMQQQEDKQKIYQLLNDILEKEMCLYLLEYFLQLTIAQTTTKILRNKLELFQQMLVVQFNKKIDYRCITCGYESNILSWSCKSCREWEVVYPTYIFDLIIN